MYARKPLPDELHTLIAAQSGVVTSAQVAALGVSRAVHRRASRDWTELALGIFVVGDVTWQAFAQASLFRGGSRAVLGGGTACFLLGLVKQPPSQFTVWAPTYRSPLVFDEFRADFRRGERRGRGDPARLPVDDALVDFAGEATEDDLVEAVTRAFADKKTTPARLRATVARRKRLIHRQVLVDLCEASNAGIHSVLEWRFHTEVLTPHELPLPGRQVQLGSRHRVDVFYEEHGVIVELDGRAFHDDDTDARRDNEHALNANALTLRFTWRQVIHEPCSVARTVARALRQRGWEGGVQACRRCRRVRAA